MRTATCRCGQLRIDVHGEPLGVGVCHCFSCQRRTGSVFAALAAFAAPYEVTGTATEYVHTGNQGAQFRFRFCPVCGTSVFHTEEGGRNSVSVAVGASRIRAFRRPRTRSTTAVATAGSCCPRRSELRQGPALKLITADALHGDRRACAG